MQQQDMQEDKKISGMCQEAARTSQMSADSHN